MKINSNTIVLAKDSDLYKELEQVVTKIAEEHEISNVSLASLDVTKDEGLISFKYAVSGIGTSEGVDIGGLQSGQLKGRIQELEEAVKNNPMDSVAQNELNAAKSQLEAEGALLQQPSEAGRFAPQEETWTNPQTGEEVITNPYGTLSPEEVASAKAQASNSEILKKIAEMYEEEEEIAKIDDVYSKAKQLVRMHEDMDYTEEEELDLIKEIFEQSKYMLNLHGVKVASSVE